MKLLLDQNISRRIVEQLQHDFPGSSQVQLLGLESASDEASWQYAKEKGFTIVTKDADFQELPLLHGPPPKVIWLQCGNASNNKVLALLHSQSGQIQSLLANDEIICLEVS